MQRDDLIGRFSLSTDIHITNVDTQSAPGFQNTKALAPNPVQLLNITLNRVSVAYLPRITIVFDVPVWWRSHDKMYDFVFNVLHRPRVITEKELVCSPKFPQDF